MIPVFIATAAFSIVWWVSQLVLCRGYHRAATRPQPVSQAARSLPKFIVFVPVRGLDETLPAAIQSVANLDYPNFTVQILFDSREDAAWSAVQEELERLNDPRISTHVIEQRLETCSVLCGNLIVAINQLDDSHELMAICAADMIVPRDWLRIMANAMRDPAVGATLGNRWYLPPVASAGGLVRWMWNAGAVVIMQHFRLPWSGGMALRVREIRTGGLLDRWATAMVEDVSVAAHFKNEPDHLRFVPGLIVVDREDIGLRAAYRFIRRQLLWTRLYSSHWLFVAGHAWCSAIALFGPLIFALFAIARGDFVPAAASFLFYALYIGAMLSLLRLVETGAGSTQPDDWPRFAGLPLPAILLVAPLAQLVYLAAVCSAALAGSVEWRGIRYAIRGRGKIRCLGYQPCR
ncbi:MAG: glycosyltransferase [Chthoniobacterales bacterium]